MLLRSIRKYAKYAWFNKNRIRCKNTADTNIYSYRMYVALSIIDEIEILKEASIVFKKVLL